MAEQTNPEWTEADFARARSASEVHGKEFADGMVKNGVVVRKVSDLEINDEAMGLIVFGLARECHEFALSRGIASHSVEDQLPLVFSVLGSNMSDLLDVRDVVTGDATCLAALNIGFSDEGYRRLADTAKDRMAGAVDSDCRVV